MSNSLPPTKKKSVLVTITPYNEQEKRVINNSTPNIPTPPVPPPLPLLTKPKTNEDSVEMQSIESFKLKETPTPVIPKPPPTYFPVTSNTTAPNGSPRHTNAPSKGQVVNGKDQASTSPITTEPPKTVTSPTNNATNPKPAAGKVAIRIGAYEGEAKQPSKLDFLSQQSRVEKNGADELANGPVVSRLQNELAATLQRSNLRRKTDGETQPAVKTIPENAVVPNNDTTNSEPNKLPQSTVEKLASALNNKVTIKVNPENNSR